MGWIGSADKLVHSSKTAPRIFIFLIVLGTEYLSYVKFIATYALTFFGYIISVLASVISTAERLSDDAFVSRVRGCAVLYVLSGYF